MTSILAVGIASISLAIIVLVFRKPHARLRFEAWQRYWPIRRLRPSLRLLEINEVWFAFVALGFGVAMVYVAIFHR